MKQFVILMVCTLVLGVGVYIYFDDYNEEDFENIKIKVNEKVKEYDQPYEPVLGLDLSKYQGTVDFSEIESQVDFVIMRATMGAYDYDERLDEYSEAAEQTQLKLGYYHLFKFEQDGGDQADAFLSRIEGKRCDLPLTIDFEEHAYNKLNGRDNANRTMSNLRTMVDTLVARGHKVMIYCNRKIHEQYIDGNFDDVYLWLAAYYILPNELREDILFKKNLVMYQFTDKCRIKGITENTVDVNFFFGTKQHFELFCKTSVKE